jgi:hypothetical protein
MVQEICCENVFACFEESLIRNTFESLDLVKTTEFWNLVLLASFSKL